VSNPSPATDDLTAFEQLASSRRTSLRVDPDRAVPVELVQRLCRLATWAPNHRKTWPWRFALFLGDGRTTLGESIADEMVRIGGFDDGKIAKNRVKYLRAPAVLAVASAADANPGVTAENRDAVSASVQTLLLGATAAGLASFWSSCAPAVATPVRRLGGFDADDTVVALVYFGWPIGDVPVPERPTPELVIIDHSHPARSSVAR
jgi:nitroreductase